MTKIRTFTVGDVFTVSDMLSRVSRPLFDSLSTVMVSSDHSGSDADGDYVGAGMSVAKTVLDVCYRECRDSLIAWFADLIDVDTNAIMAMEASTVLDIVEQVVESKEAADFFSRALRLFKKIPKSGITSVGQ